MEKASNTMEPFASQRTNTHCYKKVPVGTGTFLFNFTPIIFSAMKYLFTALVSVLSFSLPQFMYAQYCPALNAGGTCITNVTLNTMNNSTTGCSAGNYSLQSATTSLIQGGTYTVSVTCAANAIVSVWIDYNHNFSFESTEWVQPYTAATSGTAIISVPAGAVPGVTGMRVRSRVANLQNGSTDACLQMFSGETEDYNITIVSTTPCSGQPIAGNTTSSNNTPCIGQQIFLGITGNVAQGGLTYQWLSSPTGNPGTYAPVAGATNPFYVTSLTGNTCFRCVVTCSTSLLYDTSAALCINPGVFTPLSSCYCPCTHVGNTSCITNITFNTLNNTTPGCSGTANYNFYTTPITNVVQGQTYNFLVSTSVNSITSVWIDYNHSASFEASEWYQPATSATLGDTLITIPITSLPGQTRMRVRSRLPGNQNGSGAACIAMGSGETEDYIINILPAAQHDPAILGLNTPNGNCLSQNSNLSVTLANYGQQAINLTNNPVTIFLHVQGPNGPFTVPTTVSSGILPPAGTSPISVLISNVNLYAGGSYTFNTSLTIDTTGGVYNGLLQDDSLASAITIQNFRPTPGPVFNLCQNASVPFGQGLTVSGCATPIIDSVTLNFTLASSTNVPCLPFANNVQGACLLASTALPNIPNPTFISAVMRVTNLQTTNGGFANQVRFPLIQGNVPITNTANVFTTSSQGNTGTTSTNFIWQNTIPNTIMGNIYDSLGAGGILKVGYYSTWLGNANTNGFLLNAGAQPTQVTLKMVYSYVPNNYAWFETPSGGTSLASTSPFNPLAVTNSVVSNSTTPGDYVFWVACGPSPTCRVADTLRINPTPVANNVTTSSCETSVASNSASFNLVALNNLVSSGPYPITYYYDPANFLPVPNPSALVSGTSTIYANVMDTVSGCASKSNVNVVVDTLPDIVTVSQGLVCSPASLNAANLINYNFSIIPTNSTISYWANAQCTVPHPNPTAITTAGSVYILVATNTSPSCTDTAEGIVNISAATAQIVNQQFIGSFTYSSPTSQDPISTSYQSYADGQTADIYTSNCKQVIGITDLTTGIALGNVAVDVIIEDTVPVHNGQPYVKRHFKITPTNQDSAIVCLYFLQEDFNEYNVYANLNNWPELANPTLSNLAISQVRNGNLNTAGHTAVVIPTQDITTTYNASNEVWSTCFKVDSFSYFYAHSSNPGNAALPVLWKSFTAKKVNSHVELQWITSQERNCSHFIVEHSRDGRIFRTLSEAISSQAPDGSSDVELRYFYNHIQPLDGHNYYRIIQVDRDGKKLTSSIASVYFGNEAIITPYPNPMQHDLHVAIQVPQATELQLSLTDATGRVVQQVAASLPAGNQVLDLPTEHLSAGVYVLKVWNNRGIRFEQRVVKH
jgi:hypothetical protein